MLVIISHYIDNKFKIQENLFDFTHVSISHIEENFIEYVFKIISNYNIYIYLFYIIFNNISNNEIMIEWFIIILHKHNVI